MQTSLTAWIEHSATHDAPTPRRAREQEAEEHALIRRIAARDHQAFEHLYLLYARRLMGYLTRLLPQRELAEEVLNDVMLALWQQAQQFDCRGPLAAWLFGIARRRALQALRPARSRPIPPLAAPEGSTEDVLEASLVRQDLDRAVARALVNLPTTERAVVELAYYHELSYPEIATMVGCPVNTVKTRMARARRRLAAQLPALEVGASTWSGTSRHASTPPTHNLLL